MVFLLYWSNVFHLQKDSCLWMSFGLADSLTHYCNKNPCVLLFLYLDYQNEYGLEKQIDCISLCKPEEDSENSWYH